LNFFKNWKGDSIELITKQFAINEYKPGKIVYKEGDIANEFYIVRSGTLHLTTVVEIETIVKYPFGPKHVKHSREVGSNKIIDNFTRFYDKITRRYSYKVKDLKKGDMFGHEEIYDGTNRISSVISSNEAEVMYVNLEPFIKYFGSETIKQRLLELYPKVDTGNGGSNTTSLLIINNIVCRGSKTMNKAG